MAPGFPLCIDLVDNNCIVFGNDSRAAHYAATLLSFGAKVTVISPTLCPELQALDAQGAIRYIPRQYYRGDCTSGYLCVAVTGKPTIDLAIAAECKAKSIFVTVIGNETYGTFRFPEVLLDNDMALAVSGQPEAAARWRSLLEQELPALHTKLDEM